MLYSQLTNGLAKCLDGGDASERADAVRLLGMAGATAAIPKLLRLLGDDHAEVRGEAASAIALVRATEAIPKLLTLLEDDSAVVQSRSAFACAILNATEATPKVLSLLDHGEPTVRRRAALAVGLLGATEAVVELHQLLRDPHEWVRADAARAIEWLGDSKELLRIRSFVDCEDPLKRAVIAFVLDFVGVSEDVATALLDDHDPSVRCDAAVVVGVLGAIDATPKMVSLLNDDNPSVRGSAAHGIGWLGATEAIPKLLTLLDDDDAFVRCSAAFATGHLGTNEATPKLRSLLDDDLVRLSAATALCEVGASDAQGCVAAALRRTSRLVDRECLLWRLDRLRHGRRGEDEEAFLRFLLNAVLHPSICTGVQWIPNSMTYRVFRDECLPLITDVVGADKALFQDEVAVLHSISPEIVSSAAARKPFGLSLSSCPDLLDTKFVSAVKREVRLIRSPQLREQLETKKAWKHGRPKTHNRVGQVQVLVQTDALENLGNNREYDPALHSLLWDSYRNLHDLLREILRDEEYLVIWQRYYEGRSQTEIAEQIGVTTRTIRRYEERALVKLRASKLIKAELLPLSSTLDSSFDRSLPGNHHSKPRST